MKRLCLLDELIPNIILLPLIVNFHLRQNITLNLICVQNHYKVEQDFLQYLAINRTCPVCPNTSTSKMNIWLMLCNYVNPALKYNQHKLAPKNQLITSSSKF
jgi:hypothetical protein